MSPDRMERLRRVLAWITAELDDLGVPFQVAGGLAACAHGAFRPPHDLDLYVPEGALETLRAQLVAYKERLDRPVDREDVAELSGGVSGGRG